MKELKKYTAMMMAAVLAMAFVSCSDDDDDPEPTPTVKMYEQEDQMGRPAINTVFNYGSTSRKNKFNGTIPSEMQTEFQADFQGTLLALNPGYTTNALNWDAETISTALSNDVLTLNTAAATSFGTLNGRTLGDDVIDTELTLIFGGPDGMENPSVTTDGVDVNDKQFLSTFPYLATPH